MGAATCVPPPAGLVNWWRAEGNADDLTGGINGTLVDTTTFASGKVGQAFSFNGISNRVEIGAGPIPAPWTAEFWVNRQMGLENSAVLISDNTTALKLEQFNATQKVGFTRWGVSGGDSSFNYTAPIGTWVHLVFVGTTTNTQLYTNGAFNGSIGFSIGLPRGEIGRDTRRGFGKALKGLVDEVSLYNRILSPTEIQALYNAGAAGKCVPLNCTNNDDFACAIILPSSNNFSFVGSNFWDTGISATTEAWETDDPKSYNSVWYSWTAPVSGGVSLIGSSDSFNRSLVKVYAGSGTPTISNRLGYSLSDYYRNLVRFNAIGGTTYQFCLASGFGPGEGTVNFQLIVTPAPANDMFSNKVPIFGLFYETMGSFVGATTEAASETNHIGVDGNPNFSQTLWWTWAAPTNLAISNFTARLVADAISYPPNIGVYTNSSVSNLGQNLTLNSYATGMTRIATFAAMPGTTYYIALGGQHQNPAGNVVSLRDSDFRLRLSCPGILLDVLNLDLVDSGGPRDFDGVIRLTHKGSVTSQPLSLVLSERSGISVKGADSGYTENANNILFVTNIPPLAAGATAQVHVSGEISAPNGTTTDVTGIGYGLFAELKEQISGNWVTLDEIPITFGIWPQLTPNDNGPQGGVIRLDPSLDSAGSTFLTNVLIQGPSAVYEGIPTQYFGRAGYYHTNSIDFTNTVWLSTVPGITTNGVFTGFVTSNTTVTLTAQYKITIPIDVTLNIAVSNLPPPKMTQVFISSRTNVHVEVQGVANRRHVIQGTTNLSPPILWTSLMTNVLGGNGLFDFVLTTGTNRQTFYRAMESN